MNNRLSTSIFLIVLIAILLPGCDLLQRETQVVFPTTDENLLRTEVALTMAARMTYEAALTKAAEPTATVLIASPTPEQSISTPTITLSPTLPIVTYSPTATVLSATPTETVRVVYPTFTPTYFPDRAEFVSQSPAEGAAVSPGVGFDLVFGIKNTGDSTWNMGFYLKYMSGVSGQTHAGQPVTLVYLPRPVAPGETIYPVIDMVAPTTAGYQTSNWSLFNDDGTAFLGLSAIFYVSNQ